MAASLVCGALVFFLGFFFCRVTFLSSLVPPRQQPSSSSTTFFRGVSSVLLPSWSRTIAHNEKWAYLTVTLLSYDNLPPSTPRDREQTQPQQQRCSAQDRDITRRQQLQEPPPAAMATESNPNNNVKSTLILSRSGYRAGGKLVGTILIEHVARVSLQSVDLVVVGYCRLDSRWHKATSYPFPPDHFRSSENETAKRYWALPKASNIFWTSEITDLLPTPTYPEYVSQTPQDLLTPQPLHVPTNEEEVPKMEVSLDLQRALSKKDVKQTLMSYSFSVDLPSNLPPTITAISCRYYYTVLHHLRFKQNTAQKALVWKECPFSILTAETDSRNLGPQSEEKDENIISSKPPIHVVSHGDTLLCTLTSTEIHDSSGLGQLTVNCNGPTMFRPVSLGSARDCQTMRVSDPSGKPVTVLTVLGATKLSPGGRLSLQFDFPDMDKVGKSWAPCYQASACLQGEEMALQRENRKTVPKRNRARKLLLSTAHELVDPACTERICLTLLVPSDAPCSVSTDILDISFWCAVDMTVGSSNRSSSGDHQNLRLEIPCQLGHPKSAFESQVDEDEKVDDIVDESVDSFYSKDIRRDLRQLSYAVLQYFRPALNI
eukprot:scaffold1549_cov156-Amphora_coffeaeformis.AAC.8